MAGIINCSLSDPVEEEISLESYPLSTIARDSLDENPPLPTDSSLSSPMSHFPTQSAEQSIIHIEDFKDSPYRDMVDSVTELFGIIQENDLLQTSLQTILRGSDIVEDITSILNYCKKGSGLLGHSSNTTTATVIDNVFGALNKQNIPQRIKEFRALHFICEVLQELPGNLITTITSLTSEQRNNLIRQFQSTPHDISVHSFCDKGAWSDLMLQPVLKYAGYIVVNSHLQFHRDCIPSAGAKDLVRSVILSVLAIENIFNECTNL